MKRPLSLFIAVFIITTTSFAQSLKKYAIGQSGCNVYMFCDPGQFQRSYSDDSSVVYTGECNTSDALTYGVICVQLKEAVSDITVAEELMVSYLDYLKKAFDITLAAGYGKGNLLNDDNNTRGIVDYWTDKTGRDWKVKAWTNGMFMCVLYVYASGKLEDTQKINVFLNSFRFPAL
jgi:hypothetical protein